MKINVSWRLCCKKTTLFCHQGPACSACFQMSHTMCIDIVCKTHHCLTVLYTTLFILMAETLGTTFLISLPSTLWNACANKIALEDAGIGNNGLSRYELCSKHLEFSLSITVTMTSHPQASHSLKFYRAAVTLAAVSCFWM